MEIIGKEDEIIIYALHWQVVDLQYLKEHFILEDCHYKIFMQDPFKYYDMETYISIYHECPKLKIINNTLFQGYWGDIPILTTIRGFEGYPELEKDDGETDIGVLSIADIDIPNNPFIIFLSLIPLGIFFALSGDLLNLFIPISLASKFNKDRLLWLKAGMIHLSSTYLVIILSLDFIKKASRFIWLLIVLIGFSMLFEKYLKKKGISPLSIALIPCSASILIFGVLNQYYPILSYAAPLLMGAGEIAALKIGNIIPLPRRSARFMPYLVIICGIVIAIKTYL
ncbi:MAG: hypothetical protein KJ709_04715 [Nanoarchaeota archaeon]|nr:hypothetical protein [Nanoarchaeota archaeon]